MRAASTAAFDASIPIWDSWAVSSPATMKVAELTIPSPVAARCPSRQAMVMAPAHMPTTLASGLPVISQATSMASLQAAT